MMCCQIDATVGVFPIAYNPIGEDIRESSYFFYCRYCGCVCVRTLLSLQASIDGTAFNTIHNEVMIHDDECGVEI